MGRSKRGTIYLIHIEEKIHHAQHYTGWAEDLNRRITQHANGGTKASPLLRRANELGYRWTVVRTWKGTRHFERTIKNRGEGPALCPICNPDHFNHYANHHQSTSWVVEEASQ